MDNSKISHTIVEALNYQCGEAWQLWGPKNNVAVYSKYVLQVLRQIYIFSRKRMLA